jgi:DNA-binding MarR family transcriptional regulator
MNLTAFGTKRAFHGFLRVTRKLLASFGLTAARFDLLYAMSSRGAGRPYSFPTLQSQLRRLLGVSAPVVSRMVRSLEELGFVTRARETYGDRRQVRVTLTKMGLECIRKARRIVLRGVQRIVLDAIVFGDRRDRWNQIERKERLRSSLDALRRHFGDRARLTFPDPPAHPDD